jgi:hypothetical protein
MLSYPRRYIELVTAVRTSNPMSTRIPCSVCTLDNCFFNDLYQIFKTFDSFLACFIFLSDDGLGTNIRIFLCFFHLKEAVSLITHIHQKLFGLLLCNIRSEITGWQVMLELWTVD